MLKKPIKFVDYNGVPREEVFYFNLSKVEVTEMEVSVNGGLTQYLEKIVAAQDQGQIIALFKELILKAYGEKSPDGRRFMKSPEITRAFAETEAFTELFMEFATNADAAAAFVEGILPKDMNQIEQQTKTQ